MAGSDSAFTWPVMDVAEATELEVPDLDDTVGAPGPGDGTAILVCHGMGQQVPFETLDLVARSLLVAEPGRMSRDLPPVTLRRVRCRGKERLAGREFTRAEIRLSGRDPAGNPVEREVHLYEAYWAPLTQGKVQGWDVIKFLVGAAWKGFSFGRGGWWRRWMFGDGQRLKLSARTRWQLLIAALVVLALVTINYTLGAVAASRLFTGGSARWPDGELLRWLTLSLAAPVLAGAGLAAWFLVLGRRRKSFVELASIPSCNDPARRLRRHHRGMFGLIWVTLFLTIAGGVGMLLTIVSSWNRDPGGWDLTRGETVAMFFLWGGVLLLSYRVRYFLVEFVGDVAVYVSHHNVSRFDEVRKTIQDAALQVGRLVYQGLADGKSVAVPAPNPAVPPSLAGRTWEYGRIIVVGHSLGSVVAYDTLNALIREDLAVGRRLGAARRTALLLTFGSPLDKTAFIFRSQKGSQTGVREVAAAAVQPMIQSYDEAHRPRRWTNIWSPNDWISGSLEYYDASDEEEAPAIGNRASPDPRRVCNRVDPDACTPLAAHTEYWTNRLLARTLYEAVILPDPGDSP